MRFSLVGKKINPVTLIELVKSEPSLWDTSCSGYREKTAKKNAWLRIYRALEEDYDQMETIKQEQLGRTIIAKWYNIRDTFFRAVKKKDKNLQSKQYVYYDKIKFLLKSYDPDECDSSAPEVPFKSEDPDNHSKSVEDPDNHEVQKGKKRKLDEAPEVNQNTRDHVTTEAEEQADTHIDEDEAFFVSILSSVRAMTEDEKLDFRMGVLRLILETRDRRKSQKVVISYEIPELHICEDPQAGASTSSCEEDAATSIK